MTLSRSQRQNRRKRAKREQKLKQYLIDREKQPMFPIPEELANALGDVAPGEWITAREYGRCLKRLAAIQAGTVKRSLRNERLGISPPRTSSIPEATSGLCGAI